MDMDFADVLFHQQERRQSRGSDGEILIADESTDDTLGEAHHAGAFGGTLRETSAGERHDA